MMTTDKEFDLDKFHLKIVYAGEFPDPHYTNDLIEAAEEALATIETLRRRVAELEGERDRWKSAHHEMVDRNKLLRDRPDLPIERLQAYKQITAENAELKRQVGALREAVTATWKAKCPTANLRRNLADTFSTIPFEKKQRQPYAKPRKEGWNAE